LILISLATQTRDRYEIWKACRQIFPLHAMRAQVQESVITTESSFGPVFLVFDDGSDSARAVRWGDPPDPSEASFRPVWKTDPAQRS
jgi:hypothetical protein